MSARGTERLLLMALVKVIYQLNLFSSVFLLALTEFSLLRYCSLHDECVLFLPATCACKGHPSRARRFKEDNKQQRISTGLFSADKVPLNHKVIHFNCHPACSHKSWFHN